MPIVVVQSSAPGALETGQTVVGSAESKGPDASWTVVAFVLIVGAAFAAWGLYEWVDPGDVDPTAGFSAFAPLYILAQSIERLLEPFSKYLATAPDEAGNTTSKAAAERGRTAAFSLLLESPTEAAAAEAARAQALLTRVKRNTAVIAWGLASALAMLACGAFGIRLLTAIGFDVHVFWDVAITGLAVGSGTKPLHDLISNIQRSSENKGTPPGIVTTE